MIAGQKLAQILEDRNMRQADLARLWSDRYGIKMPTARSRVRNYLQGQDPSATAIAQLELVLGLEAGTLLPDAELPHAIRLRRPDGEETLGILVDDHAACSYGQMVCLIDGQPHGVGDVKVFEPLEGQPEAEALWGEWIG